MQKKHVFELSLVAAAVGFAHAPAINAQDDRPRTEDVRDAENELERAEERLEQAEQAVEEREDALEDAIAEAAVDVDDDPDDDTALSDPPEFDDADWQALTDEHPNLSRFVDALRLTGLRDTLASGTDYTVFAPTDEAFEAHDEDLFDEERREELVELLRAHIVADDVDPVRARSLDEALTVDGGTVELSMEDDTLMIGGAEVVNSDIRLGNLRIYPIDAVLDANPDTDVALTDFD